MYVCTKLGEMKLREFHYELNPLIPFIPIPSSATEEVLPLKVFVIIIILIIDDNL